MGASLALVGPSSGALWVVSGLLLFGEAPHAPGRWTFSGHRRPHRRPWELLLVCGILVAIRCRDRCFWCQGAVGVAVAKGVTRVAGLMLLGTWRRPRGFQREPHSFGRVALNCCACVDALALRAILEPRRDDSPKAEVLASAFRAEWQRSDRLVCAVAAK